MAMRKKLIIIKVLMSELTMAMRKIMIQNATSRTMAVITSSMVVQGQSMNLTHYLKQPGRNPMKICPSCHLNIARISPKLAKKC
ncbi:unnamed protein product [Prunus armeniaca]|uniref:Uncharacterized protein n=1 Tax=Prunus armeniaca TaxID=36596 RepID=A0A6J5WXL9_PRUAR|nr:unnamed protein product [Prunus armeniaca]